MQACLLRHLSAKLYSAKRGLVGSLVAQISLLLAACWPNKTQPCNVYRLPMQSRTQCGLDMLLRRP